MTDNFSKTELLYKKSKPIDHLNVHDSISLIINEQKKAALDVKKAAASIEMAINEISNHLLANKTSRLIYSGAGTSARIGVQDGVELFPTFGWPKERVDFIIAGGIRALTQSVEDAEDNTLKALDFVKNKKISSKDVVIALAASGNTPFTCKVIEEAYYNGALTIAISNNPNGNILNFGKIKIILDTEEEVLAGSTRLKAGSAQKICLNIISTLVMVKLGRVKNGYMSHMVVTNRKLKERKKILSEILKN